MKHVLSAETIRILDVVAAILLRGFIFLVIAQVFTWTVLYFAGDGIFSIYSHLFDISRENYNLLIIYSMSVMKVLNIVFFLAPFVAINILLRGKRERPEEYNEQK